MPERCAGTITRWGIRCNKYSRKNQKITTTSGWADDATTRVDHWTETQPRQNPARHAARWPGVVGVVGGCVAGAHGVEDVREVAEGAVAPVVELGDGGARAALRRQLRVRHPEADEAREQRLVHARVLLERLVLDHRRQLVVVADEDDLHRGGPHTQLRRGPHKQDIAGTRRART